MTHKKIFQTRRSVAGFTLIELLVVVLVIGVLAGIIYASFGDARATARDQARKVALKELQLAIETYKAQNGVYPTQGCGVPGGEWAGPGPVDESLGLACDVYIVGLVPDYIPALPKDPNREDRNNRGFFYTSTGANYKVLILNTVEKNEIASYEEEFARCPRAGSGCSITFPDNTYAVYSPGASQW